MYRLQPYTGADLPPKHLCLTYDDGPGKDTGEIAEFLHSQNIQATFFVVGKYAFHHTDTLQKIAALGHLVGNHTYEHPDMPFYLSVNGDIHNQVLRTDAVIRNYISGDTVYFRSPYGKWSPEVANELNVNLLSAVNHIGPIHWDIGGIDCYCWKMGETVDATVEIYLEDINKKGRGIVVMHDDIADMDFLKEKNKTLALTKKLIPLLKEQGYTFVRLDEIESVKKDAEKPLKCKLKDTGGRFISLSGNGNNAIISGGKTSLNELTLVETGHGKIALKASNGLFLSLQENNENGIAAVSEEISALEKFDLIPFSAGQVALRANNGNFFVKEKASGRLLAAAAFMRGSERFTFMPVGMEKERKISFRERYVSLKRQALYIKSKVQQKS